MHAHNKIISICPNAFNRHGWDQEEKGEEGRSVSVMATACMISSGERYWARNSQGVEETWPLDLEQKGTQNEIRLQKTPRDGA